MTSGPPASNDSPSICVVARGAQRGRRRRPRARSAGSASRPSAGRSSPAAGRRARRSSRTRRCRARPPSPRAASSPAPTRTRAPRAVSARLRRCARQLRRLVAETAEVDELSQARALGRRAATVCRGQPVALARSRGCRASGRGSTRRRRLRAPSAPRAASVASACAQRTPSRCVARRGARSATTSCSCASSGTSARPTCRSRRARRSSSRGLSPAGAEVPPAERDVEPADWVEQPGQRSTARREPRQEALDRRGDLDGVRPALREPRSSRPGAREQAAEDRVATAHGARRSTACSGRPKRRSAGPTPSSRISSPSPSASCGTTPNVDALAPRASRARRAVVRRPSVRSTTGAGKRHRAAPTRRARRRAASASSSTSVRGARSSTPLVGDALRGGHRDPRRASSAAPVGARELLGRAGPGKREATRRARARPARRPHRARSARRVIAEMTTSAGSRVRERLLDRRDRRVGPEVRDRPAARGEREPEADQRQVVQLARRAREHRPRAGALGPSRARARAAGRAARCSRSAPARRSPRRAPSARRARAGTEARRRGARSGAVNAASRRSSAAWARRLVEPVERRPRARPRAACETRRPSASLGAAGSVSREREPRGLGGRDARVRDGAASTRTRASSALE